ncbi:signal peptide peptidase SppA [Pasteurellaceae bacterium LIM206]|nr:signal peptide peptidase SppA [Pasteurellaceae bacterium LIM206]
MLNIVKWLWRGLCFIRDLVMNVFFLCFMLFVIVLMNLFFAERQQTVLIGDQGALLLNLDGYLTDNRDEEITLRKALRELNSDHVPQQISTFDVVYAIENAADDDRIKGLVLDLNYFQGADMPALTYIGSAIQHFKQSRKPVIAMADNYGQSQYLLASYADEIYLNPIGEVAIEGLSIQNLYFKNLLEKLAVTPHIFRVGTYKAAVEPFLRNDMSPEAKNNLQRWLTAMWRNYRNTVAENRHIQPAAVLPEVKNYVQDLKNLRGDGTAYATQRKLVSKLATRYETRKYLTALFGAGEDNQPKLLEFNDYLAALPDRIKGGSEYRDPTDKIAVVNVEGSIIDGDSYEENVGGDTIAKLLRKALDDNKVKAVILRVNSPGGSAFASEVIRQEVDGLQQAGKPVVVSMGAMAASGGYWISSTADYIVADKNTITGSIGIFAMRPTFENSLKKVGINTDGIATSALSQNSGLTPLPTELSNIYQLQVEHGYDRFLQLVSQGRKLTKSTVDKIAQGQVWLGEEAYQHKLIDELGNFDTALNKAIELAKAKYPNAQDFSVEWFTDEDSGLLTTLLKDLRQETKATLQGALNEFIGLPVRARQVQRQLGQLSKFNDPKGQYLYCLNCGTVK